jgi:4-alpha-glucanotransferase
MSRVALLLGVHAHQPVGNFDFVMDDAHHRCYAPFLRTLHGYPEFKFTVHFSGWLLDYLIQHFPKDMALLETMVARGQVELFGAGDTEPVLAVIPNRDRIGQVRTLSDKLEKKLGARPRGAWLTERVWEATVVPALADAGIDYVTVDDYHFLCTGKQAAELTGFYTTEEDGRRLDLFPIAEALRYRLPFSPAAEAVSYIESLAQTDHQAAAVYFDDIEKFGIWPETYEWVYEKGWLAQFIEGVLASDVIVTSRYDAYHAAAKTRGVVYLPTTSYIEMNEWTLPANAANTYGDLMHEAKAQGRFEQHKAFLRGGMWKNFLSRYPESNWMHKRMLGLSARFHALPKLAQTTELRELLYEAQANDAYWHGLFGGLYLPHLRRAVYHAMVTLEARLDAVASRAPREQYDLDFDGQDELLLHNDQLQAIVRLDGSATVAEFDAYALRHNFGDSLARQAEHYHRKIHLGDAGHAHSGEGIASAHDRVTFKHDITPDDMRLDTSPRALFRDHWVDAQRADAAPPYPLDYQELESEGLSAKFEAAVEVLKVDKSIAVQGASLVVAYRFSGGARGWFGTEINLAMPSCDGPAGRFVHQGNIPGGFGAPLNVDDLTEIELSDDVLGGSVILRASRPVRLSAAPHFSVSQSEAGFEKIMQAVTLSLVWPLRRERDECVITLEVVPHRR